MNKIIRERWTNILDRLKKGKNDRFLKIDGKPKTSFLKRLNEIKKNYLTIDTKLTNWVVHKKQTNRLGLTPTLFKFIKILFSKKTY